MLRRYIRFVDRLNEGIGRVVAWLLPAMTAVTLFIIVAGAVFRAGWVWLGESVVYMHAALFTLAAAYTLAADGHVRVDVFYNRLPLAWRMRVNLFGVFVLLLPACAVILLTSYSYVIDSWSLRETSPDAQGLPAVFLLKSCILLMPLLLILQGLALAARSWLALRGEEVA